MMNTKMVGSDLTRSMLMSGYKEVWCAISDDCDEDAMMDHFGNDFTAYIVSFYDGQFYCNHGRAWAFAVPIKIIAVEQSPMEDESNPVGMMG
ncbi:hypothetical protein ACTXGJ_08505 [Psychrobacter sp. 1Y11]